jgi:hypothetical protein
MSAFCKPGFVVNVLDSHGKRIREFGENGQRTIRMPFDNEYIIQMKNTTKGRAYVRIEIDGTDALSGRKLILPPGETKDLERFLEDDTKKGRRFKFVTSGDPGVSDPTARENGLVRVIFEPEILPDSSVRYTYENLILRDATFGSSGSIINAGASGSVVNTAYACTSSVAPGTSTNHFPISESSAGCTFDLGRHLSTSDVGATAAGSTSHQRFTQSNEYFPTTTPVTIDVWIRGPKVETQDYPYRLTGVGAQMCVMHNAVPGCAPVPLGFVESAEMTPTHLVIKIPVAHVSCG